MNYEVKILDEKVVKLLLYLEEMQLIQFTKKPSKKADEPQKRSFGGRISKERAADLHSQLKEMRERFKN